MKRKHYIILAGCLLIVSLTLLMLYAFSPMNSSIYRATFERRFIEDSIVTKIAEMDLNSSSFYLAGTTQDKIYLGNTNTPFIINSTSWSLKELAQAELKITGIGSVSTLAAQDFKMVIDSPYFYLLHGLIPQVYRGNIADWTATPIMKQGSFYFTAAVPISPSSFIMRSHNNSEQSYELAKKTIDSPYFRFENRLLQKQVDGIFCLDGQLHYCKEVNRIVYQHYYRNELVVADTNLNLLFRGHTIDTFRVASLKISNIEGRGVMTMSAPPRPINTGSTTYKGHLFVGSNLLSMNEVVKHFSTNAVIDIYDLKDGSYKGSFYIPYYQNKRPTEFQLYGPYLIARYENNLVLYDSNVNAYLDNLFHLSHFASQRDSSYVN